MLNGATCRTRIGVNHLGRVTHNFSVNLAYFHYIIWSWQSLKRIALSLYMNYKLNLLKTSLKLVSLEEFHLPSFGDSWTYCWSRLSICSILAVLSKFNQQPIHSHLTHQRGSCKQISPTFVTYPVSFLIQMSLCSVEFWTMRQKMIWNYPTRSHNGG